MMKFALIGAALVLFSGLATPAIAKHAKHAIHPRHHVQQAVCDPRDPGNPYSERYDYLSWSAWRRRGGWDTRNEWTCQPIPEYALRPGFQVRGF
jgi:hypothetical protein